MGQHRHIFTGAYTGRRHGRLSETTAHQVNVSIIRMIRSTMSCDTLFTGLRPVSPWGFGASRNPVRAHARMPRHIYVLTAQQLQSGFSVRVLPPSTTLTFAMPRD